MNINFGAPYQQASQKETPEEQILRVCAHRMEVQGNDSLAREFRWASGRKSLSLKARKIYDEEAGIL